jgi:hypothetical protein
MPRSEFDYLMAADTRLAKLEAKGYRVYQDKFGGIMVKGPSVAIYNHYQEYSGAHDGERVWNQVEALCRDLGERDL